jgi:ribonuclease HI
MSSGRSLEVFTDGSYRRRRARYCFLVLHNSQRLYVEAGKVAPWRDGFPGRVRSNDCEVFAALRALDWLRLNMPTTPATLVTDSQSISELLTTRPSDPYLLFLRSRLVSQNVVARKTQGHHCCMHNKEVDRLAKSAAGISLWV